MSEDWSPRTGHRDAAAGTDPAWRLADTAWGRPRAAPRAPRPLAGAAAVCAGLALVGAFGPWVRVYDRAEPVETVRGVQTDGVVVAVAAVVALVALVALLARPESTGLAWAGLVGLGVCLLSGGVALFLFDSLTTWVVSDVSWNRAEAGWGLETVTVAGAVGTACAAIVVRRVRF